MNSEELNSLILSGQPHLLIDVLPEEVHAASCIPGSTCVCVYEMAFLDKVTELTDSKNTIIIVYGAGGGAHDSKVAAEKLKAAGYLNVLDLAEGLAGWRSAGLPVKGSGIMPAAPVAEGRYVVSPTDSVVRWTGRNLFNHHSGTVGISSGEIVLTNGRLQTAGFVIDLKTIRCEDIADQEMNAMLLRHLHDADFFNAARHPTAEFQTTSAEPIEGSSEGLPNFLLKGNLTLRGITHPLEFPAVIAIAEDGRISGQAQFEIDRTAFGSIYGSGRFFRHLGKHVVNDLIHLHVKIHADPAPQD